MSEENKYILEVNDLHTSFFTDAGEVQAVNGISFRLEPGKTLGIVGESGSGKSVTAYSIMQILAETGKITAGEVKFHGEDITKWDGKQMQKFRGEKCSIIFQDPMTSLNPVFTVGSQLTEAVLLHTDKDKKQAWARAVEMLTLVGVNEPESRMKQYPHELSGGMRQRVMIAMALACEPDILIADEPTTALDVNTQASILQLLKKLNQKYGMSILFISHNLRVVGTLCSRVLVMKDGEVVEEGSTEEIFSASRHEYTKALIAAIPSGTNDKTVQGTVLSEQRPKVLELRHVNAYYKEGKLRRQILKDVSFALYEGEMIGLVGESGSGKSTLCKCVLGLLKDYEGEVVHYTERPQMVFQDPYASLNPKKTIGWILEEPLRVRKEGDKKSRRTKAEAMLERVHLPKEIYDRYPRELSGGQRQRVSIALALMTGTRFILADEVLSALDVTVQAQMIELLKELQAQERICYLFVSHDLDVVNMICDRVLVLKDGYLHFSAE